MRAVFTNTVWVDAYRGAGRPETAYILERLVDRAARETGLSADEIRRRNFVLPEAMPYKTPMIVRYDSGDFPRNLDTALKAADCARLRGAARRGATKRGKLRGIGIAYYMEVTANMPQEKADIRFLPDGRVFMGDRHRPVGPRARDRVRANPRGPARHAVRPDRFRVRRHRQARCRAAAPAAPSR